VGKPHRIRQTESQSDQSKTVPHDNQDIEASTSEQSNAHQIAPEDTPSCGKHCAQDSGGRAMLRQKGGHPARLEVHHRNGKDRSEDSPKSGKQRKLVTARSSELGPGARSTPQTTLIRVTG